MSRYFHIIIARLLLCCAVSGPTLAQSPAPNTSTRNEPILPLFAVEGLDNRKVSLGEKLFHDPLLSRDQKRSCASCHDIAKGGADKEAFSYGYGNQESLYNSPTILNLEFNYYVFWRGNMHLLDKSMDRALMNPKTMAMDWDTLLERLKKHPSYPDKFKVIYSDAISVDNVRDAVNEYQRSLVSLNAPFDQWLKGDDEALSAQELRGYQSFKTLGCISCHNGKNVGGTLLMQFGVYSNEAIQNERDQGRFLLTGNERDKYTFRVPSLRNVALTAPYFHDGRATTLEGAVEIMAQIQLGRTLSAQETQDIVAFLHTLTGQMPEVNYD
ncbi:cytochrome-c peroxidase [Kordiimonas sp. SCSIO 12610]|uniref:cytochrome-c peroxidase n=1 Tax=Kordiimonas sp. SCSIO 12610 TaxID=2829597 RepID=UPI00210BC95A|nr:cytochrome c peroxidase [Kordiimonas sp. SCSIO 12610]UTW54743.1 c-type cytochrome [Kordiimonas sp. SCSIO 12610]